MQTEKKNREGKNRIKKKKSIKRNQKSMQIFSPYKMR